MNLLPLKALGLVALLFLRVYLPTFLIVGLIKPRPQVAIPLIVGLSLAVALTFIYFLSARTRGILAFRLRRLRLSLHLDCDHAGRAGWVCAHIRCESLQLDESVWRPIAPAVDDFSLFRHRDADSGRDHLPWTPPDDIGAAT
jgi:hypothetical protein